MTGPDRPAVRIREATLADVDALVAILVDVAGEGRWIGTEAPVDVERRRQRMAADLEGTDGIVLVAEAGGEPVGQLGLRLAPYGVADLGMLVAAGWRGRGVGTALLAEAVRRAREAGGEPVGQLGLELARYGVAELGMLVAAGWRGRGPARP